MLKDKNYWIYHFFIACIIAVLLAMEDLIEGQGFNALDLLENVLVFLVVVFCISWMVLGVVQWLNHVMPWEVSLFSRFLVETVIILAGVVFFTLISSGVLNFVREPDADSDFGFEILALIMFFITIFMLFALHEFMTLSAEKESLLIRAKILQKQNHLAKYEALKNQINPHFLFNSLNVLSSLIYKDIQKSDQFIKKFSDVFRYVLELNNENLVPVKRELLFLESYLFLQKIRYGDHLQIHQTLDSAVLHMLIPPLTLQLVVENALKHNIISDSHNLSIWIENTFDEIIVKNNYQVRVNGSSMVGIGQQNLCEKYQLIAQRVPRFYVEDNFYISRLPVLKQALWNEF
jgi:sensor histidine kinase YesM